MPEILDNLTPAERAEANHTNLIEAFDYLLSLPDVERHPHADLTGVITGQPAGFLNPITVSNFPDDEADARIDVAMDVLRDRELEMEWWVGPASSPGDPVERLHRVPDFATGNPIPGMSADLANVVEPPVPDGVEIIEVGDDEQLRDWPTPSRSASSTTARRPPAPCTRSTVRSVTATPSPGSSSWPGSTAIQWRPRRSTSAAASPR